MLFGTTAKKENASKDLGFASQLSIILVAT